MNKQITPHRYYKNGFTLIELVVVIVILGILAAAAAPKFMDLKRDAVISGLNGLKGSLASAVSMSQSKMIIQGTSSLGNSYYGADCNTSFNPAYCIDLDGKTKMRVKGGFPDSSEVYKAVDADVRAYSKQCYLLTDAERKCNSEWCWCDKLQTASSISADIRSRLGTNNNLVTEHDIAVFWPKGYTFDGKVDTKQCYLIYQQAVLGTATAPGIRKYPSLLVVADGC